MELSKYQQDIVDWVVNGTGNAVVEAVAGSGKSTTLVIAAQYMDGRGIFLAFNKHIATSLRGKLAASLMSATTMHSVGLSALRARFSGEDFCQLDSAKYRNRVKSMSWTWNGQDRMNITKLVDLARLYHSADGVNLHALAQEYDIPYKPHYEGAVDDILAWGKENVEVIDYTDMLWLPIVLDIPFPKYEWVAVDEAQDLSALQLAIVQRLLGENGRLLAVGDRRQAIFHFAGANSDSFESLIEATNAKLLPLSVCYRCPSSVVERAREYCPQIEVAPGAGAGIVAELPRAKLVATMRPGDMVLCRLTYPLITVCYEFIVARKKAYVRGRNIGEKLAEMVRRVLGKRDPTMTLVDFSKEYTTWVEDETARLVRITPESKLEDVISRHIDNCRCIEVMIRSDSTISTVGHLLEVISELFTDQDDASTVTLSTIHRAKGLESNRVAILDAEISGNKMSPTQLEQEDNLKYVAITRAKSELYFVK